MDRREAIRDVKIRLMDNQLTQIWLLNRLEEIGIKTSKYTLSSILSGYNDGPLSNQVLEGSLKILEKYEKAMK